MKTLFPRRAGVPLGRLFPAGTLCALALLPSVALASSHMDAPLITLDDEAAAAWLATHGGGNGAAAHDRPEIAAELQRVIDGVNAKLARVEQIKKFKVLPRPFGIDTGELTPTLKVKRKVVNQNFAAEIESMYADA